MRIAPSPITSAEAHLSQGNACLTFGSPVGTRLLVRGGCRLYRLVESIDKDRRGQVDYHSIGLSQVVVMEVGTVNYILLCSLPHHSHSNFRSLSTDTAILPSLSRRNLARDFAASRAALTTAQEGLPKVQIWRLPARTTSLIQPTSVHGPTLHY